MGEIQALEQRFEGVSVQDENQDINATIPQHKSKVSRTWMKIVRKTGL